MSVCSLTVRPHLITWPSHVCRASPYKGLFSPLLVLFSWFDDYSVMSGFIFCMCISYRLLVVIRRLLPYIYIYNCFKMLISDFQMYFNNPAFVFSPPSWLLFLIPYFTSKCCIYLLTAYGGYRWLYHLCLLILPLALYMDVILSLFCWVGQKVHFWFFNADVL